MTTRRQRAIITLIEAWADQDRLHIQIARHQGAVYGVDSGIAAIDPADLAGLLRTDPAAAWLLLAGLTPAQLVIEAIDYTAWLNETTRRDLSWCAVLEVFEARIARLSLRQAA